MGPVNYRYRIDERRVPLEVGETRLQLALHETGRPGHTFVHLHADEQTAVEATRRVLAERGGRLVELRHAARRDVAFTLDGREYLCNPNRIFTGRGAAATLRTLGAYSDAAHAAVRSLARALLGAYALEQLDVVIAVHNTSKDRFSAQSFKPGERHERAARRVHIADAQNPGDFFYVTEDGLFEQLREAACNVVLQDPDGVQDDGSLSVYCAHRRLPYVNLEAQHGHVQEQAHLLRILLDLLREGG